MASVNSFIYALDSENYKLAKDTLSKLVKKAPTSVHYKLLSNYYDLKVNCDFEGARLKTLKLFENSQSFSSVTSDMFQLVVKIFTESNHPEDIGKIYEILLKRQPSNKNLVSSWYRYSISIANVSLIQKSSFHLQKLSSSPDEKRKNTITAAFNYYLAAEHTDIAIEKKIFPQLGLKLIDGASELKSDQEIYVKVKLMIMCKQFKQVAELILGLLKSRKFNEVDLSLVLLYCEALAETKEYSALYDFTSSIIFPDSLEKSFNDFNFWNFLLLAAFELGHQEKLLDLMDSSESLKTTRNFLLAKIGFAFLSKDKALVKSSILAYYTNFGGKKCAFDDLLRYFEFPELDINWFIEEVIIKKSYSENQLKEKLEKKGSLTISEVTLLVNKQKFIFLRDENEIQTSSECQNFVQQTQNLYDLVFKKYHKKNLKMLTDDCFIGNELVILMLEAELSSDFSIKNIIKYVIVLKDLINKSPKDFYVKLWLIKLYNYLNLPILAAEIFDSLKIANVQIDTLMHLMTTRLSSQFPNVNLHLKPNIYKKLQYFQNENSDYYLAQYLEEYYSLGAYTKIEKYIEFLKRSRSSFEKYYSFMEMAKTESIVPNKLTSEYKQWLFDGSNIIKMVSPTSNDIIVKEKKERSVLVFNTTGKLEDSFSFSGMSTGYADNRDFNTLWEYGAGHEIEALNKDLSIGPIPKSRYLKLNSLLLRLSDIIVKFDTSEATTLLSAFFSLVDQGLDEFTEIEQLQIRLFYNFYKFCREAFAKKEYKLYLDHMSNIFEQVFKSLDSLQSSDNEIFNWKYAHNYITVVATFKLFNRVLKKYKQQYPSLFNKSNKNFSIVNTSIIQTVHSLSKKLQAFDKHLKSHEASVSKKLDSIKSELKEDRWTSEQASFSSSFDSLYHQFGNTVATLRSI